MKSRFSIGLACCVIALSARAQESTNAPSPAVQRATPLTSRVLERGQNFSKIESITQKQDASGQTILKTNRYTRLKPGINRKDVNGEWIESQPVLLNRPEGIVGTGGVYTVTISPELNTRGAVDLRLPNGQRFQSHAIGLSWYDPDTGRSVLLAAVKSCAAEISSNQVIFRDAFDNGVSAAVVYKYEAGQFQQDVVFHSSPPAAPADFGSRTRLEVMTEIIKQPSITKKVRTLYEEKDAALRTTRAEPDLVDETLQLGGTNGLRMVQGRAFRMGQAPTNRTMVLKRLVTTSSGRTVLIESMPWEPVKAEFEKLPRTASVTPRLRTSSLERELPPPLLAHAEGVKTPEVLLAASPITKGFVLDYTTVSGWYSWFYFATETYFIDGFVEMDTADFGISPTYKFSDGGTLQIDAYGYWYSGVPNGTFTSIDDDSVGDIIDGSSGSPSVGNTTMLDLVCGGYVDNAEFRYAGTAVVLGAYTSLHDDSFYACDTAIKYTYGLGSPYYIAVYDTDFCEVSRWLVNGDDADHGAGLGLFNVTVCGGDPDADGDAMPLAWELAWFNNTEHSAATDADGDGANDEQEYQQGLNPLSQDCDNDGVLDGQELQQGLNPLSKDSNNDGVIDQVFKANAGRPSVSSLIP